jgi:hypothetical protein
MLVVSDTSPIRALHHLGLLNLLHDLYATSRFRRLSRRN